MNICGKKMYLNGKGKYQKELKLLETKFNVSVYMQDYFAYHKGKPKQDYLNHMPKDKADDLMEKRIDKRIIKKLKEVKI